MYFQKIYGFEVDLLKKFAMSFPLEQSRPREISAGRYEFGWGASPDATIGKEPTNQKLRHHHHQSCHDIHFCSSRQCFTGGKLLQDFCQVLKIFSMETFFSGGDVGVWILKRIYKSMMETFFQEETWDFGL